MSEMVERVARALKANLAKQFQAKPLLGDEGSGDWHATGGTIDLEEMARAAIEAMREPTPKMITAGLEVSMLCGASWQTMINAALSVPEASAPSG